MAVKDFGKLADLDAIRVARKRDGVFLSTPRIGLPGPRNKRLAQSLTWLVCGFKIDIAGYGLHAPQHSAVIVHGPMTSVPDAPNTAIGAVSKIVIILGGKPCRV